MYDNLAYDEDPHFHCMVTTHIVWVLDPSYIKVNMATSMIPPDSVVEMAPCIRVSTPFVPTTDPLWLCRPTSLALWA